MIETTTLAIITIFMVIYAYMKGDKQSFLLTVGISFGIMIATFRISGIFYVGLTIYMLTTIAIVVLTINNRDLSTIRRGLIILTATLAFATPLFSIMNWPLFEIIKLFTVASIFLYAIVLSKGMMGKNEFGYLTIINVNFLVQLIYYVSLSEDTFFRMIGIAYILMFIYLVLGLIFSKNKTFFKWNFICFLIYSIIVFSLMFDPSSSSYGQALMALAIGIWTLIIHYVVIFIVKLIVFLKKPEKLI